MSILKVQPGVWRRRVLGATAALVLSAGGILALAGPAAAAPNDCPAGFTCNYSGYNYRNDAWQQPSTHKFANCVDVMANGWRTYGNVISSTFNNGRLQNSYLYRDEYKGTRAPLFVQRGGGIANVGTFNDDIESGYFDSTRNRVGSALCS